MTCNITVGVLIDDRLHQWNRTESSESRMFVDETGWAVDQTDQLFVVWCFVRESVQRRRVRARPPVRRELRTSSINGEPVVLYRRLASCAVRPSACQPALLYFWLHTVRWLTACLERARIKKSGRCCPCTSTVPLFRVKVAHQSDIGSK